MSGEELPQATRDCVRREVDAVETGVSHGDERYVTLRRENDVAYASYDTTPPVSERALDFPGVDPSDVLRTCWMRGEYECVVRTARSIDEPTSSTRRHLLSALAALEDWEAMRTELARVPAREAWRYSRYQAILWRIERGLPRGPRPSPMDIGL